MQNVKNRIIAISVIVLLSLSMATMLSQTAKAQTQTYTKQLYCFLAVQPNPIGVGQTVVVAMWLDTTPFIFPNNTETPWMGYYVTITLPDNTTTKMGPFNSDAAATHAFDYTPTEVGTYYFQMSFAGQNNSALYGKATSTYTPPALAYIYYPPAVGSEVPLTVQSTPIASPSLTPLPVGYWQTPVDAQNTNWATISGNWLGVGLTYGNGASSDGAINPYSTAPTSAHIVWTKLQTFGGVAGGNVGVGQTVTKSFTPGGVSGNGLAYYTGLSYNSHYGPPIIIDGYLYYNLPQGPDSGGGGGCNCVNLATGQVLWWQNITVSVGQILDYETGNQHGAISYLWQTGATYKMFDPVTGDLVLTLTGASTGRITMDGQGDMLVYVVNNVAPAHWLAMWNSSYASYMQGLTGGAANTWAPPLGATEPWLSGVQWNVTIPAAPVYSGSEGIATVGDDVLVAACVSSPLTICAIGYNETTGVQLYQDNITANQLSPTYFLVPTADNIFVFFRQETQQWFGYNVYTGALEWTASANATNAWGMFTSSTVGLGASNPLIAYGTLYTVGYDGYVHAFNDSTGTNLWNWYDGQNINSPYGQNPLGSGTFAIADNQIYAATGTHSPVFFNGAQMYDVNAISGQEVWSIDGWFQNPAVADGYLTAFNNYDGLLYCFGQGQTATTITAPQLETPGGDTVLLQGSVTDQSPGQTCLGIPAKGTPAISDASQSAWMEYLYMQQPEPLNATGVPVTLSYVDPNGNYYLIGNTTSDITGHYAYNFSPTVPGLYTVTATFQGSNSYFASSAETSFTYGATVTPTSTPTSVADMYFVPAIAGIVVLIIVVAIVLALLMLRKRP